MKFDPAFNYYPGNRTGATYHGKPVYQITDWAGRQVAMASLHSLSKERHGVRVHFWRAEFDDGTQAYGKNQGPGALLRLHRRMIPLRTA